MTAPSTRGLERRAHQAANFLEDWAKRLRAELKRQNLEFHANPLDEHLTVTLPVNLVRVMADKMSEHASEIRRFESNPARRPKTL